MTAWDLGLRRALVIQPKQPKFCPPCCFLLHPRSMSNISGADLAFGHRQTISCTVKSTSVSD